MSLATSLLKHGARAAAGMTVGVLRDVTTDAMHRLADFLQGVPRPRAVPRRDALARAAVAMSEAPAPRPPTVAAGALITGALIGAGMAVLLATRR